MDYVYGASRPCAKTLLGLRGLRVFRVFEFRGLGGYQLALSLSLSLLVSSGSH